MIHKYLLEIKYRILFSFITWCFIMLNCYYFKETLLYTFIKLTLTSENTLLYFLTTDVAEVFTTYIQLSYYVANQTTFLFVYCQIFVFVSTGLFKFEYDYFKTVLVSALVCWVICIFTLNHFIFPISWNFFLKFQDLLSFQSVTCYFEAKLSEYLIFYKSIYYLCSLLCQIVILLFAFLDLVKTNLFFVKKLRKIFYLLSFVFSTFLTPPEVTYQLIISLCMIVIYELTTVYLIFKTEICIK